MTYGKLIWQAAGTTLAFVEHVQLATAYLTSRKSKSGPRNSYTRQMKQLPPQMSKSTRVGPNTIKYLVSATNRNFNSLHWQHFYAKSTTLSRWPRLALSVVHRSGVRPSHLFSNVNTARGAYSPWSQIHTADPTRRNSDRVPSASAVWIKLDSS